ncbi:MAG: hypothetical protein ACRDSI_13680 [Pseudonocardiaceae bacterium]
MAPNVCSAGLGLMPAPKDRPVQAVADFWFAAASEVEQSADFGEGERDQVSVDGWCGFWFGRRVGWFFLLV